MGTDTILEIKWSKQDVVHVLEEEGVPVTDGNVEKMIAPVNLKMLQERSVERGWDVLFELARESF